MSGAFAIGVEYPKTAVNIGTLLRSAYNFGAATVFTVGHRYRHQSSDTVEAFRHLPLMQFDSWEQAWPHLPHEWEPVAVELCPRAKSLVSFVHPKQAIYLLGKEDGNVSEYVLNRCQGVVQIPSLLCLNVAVAGSIVMYDRLAKETAK